jgi:hypothetical protein
MSSDVGFRSESLFKEGVAVAIDLMESDSTSVLEELIHWLRDFNEKNCSPPKGQHDIYEIAYRCMKAAAKRKGDESDLKRDVLGKLSDHFIVHEEVWGNHWSGKRVRIDAILTPKDDSEWKTKSPRLGVEFKNFRSFDPSFNVKDYTKWWAQCHDYAETSFDGYGYVPVFSYNGFSHYRQRMGGGTATAFAVRFWGRLGVGEIVPSDLMFVMNGTNKIWSMSRGVIDGRRISMDRKFGSR